ncbi:solute carrier family 30 (zinc transporter), member 4 [Sarotherodon galilaeus]
MSSSVIPVILDMMAKVRLFPLTCSDSSAEDEDLRGVIYPRSESTLTRCGEFELTDQGRERKSADKQQHGSQKRLLPNSALYCGLKETKVWRTSLL